MRALIEVYRPCEKFRFLYATSEEAKEHRRPTKEEQQNKGDIVPLKNSRGNSASHLLSRLKRDHQDIAEDYRQGKYKSVRAAAIAAGIP